ncbi:uncharacterized protein V1510DRAFT_418923 [Dipodascopsis tothii]|uniref:uncharacterized protein n=1 Tax=Dipodascopsis tothii TaxID=44089 RepID=UPI0034CFE2E2
MAGAKRKRGESQSEGGKPAGAQVADKAGKAAAKADKPAPTAHSITKPITLSRAEDSAFPRGGASVLTALEYKEAANEAMKDVLFETQRKAPPKAEAQARPEKEAKTGHAKAVEVKKRLAARAKRNESKKPAKPTEAKIKIEGLSYKRLVPGTVVLGQVAEINAFDLALSLPNSITGFVPITSISAGVSAQVDALAEDSEDEEAADSDGNGSGDDADESDAESDAAAPAAVGKRSGAVDLKAIFAVGQWLRAVVVAGDGAKKKHIELSVAPSQVNATIAAEDLVKGLAVQASVQSVEDHGAILDLGFDSISGFISKRELEFGGYALDALAEGQVMLLTVLSKSSNGRTVTLTATAVAKKLPAVQTVANVDSVLPGTLVEVLVTQVSGLGVAGRFSGLVDATVDYFHLNEYDSDAIKAKFKDGQKLRARVTSYLPSADTKKLRLSLLPHVVALTKSAASEAKGVSDMIPLGLTVSEAKVRYVEPGIGVFVDVGVDGVLGFVHISRLSDERVTEISPAFGPYKVGSIHRARVIRYSLADGLVTLSMEKKVLDRRYLQFGDVAVGDVADGEIVRLVPSGGLLVALSDDIVGHVNELHISDVKLAHPERKFKPGMKVKCRVLATNPDRRKIRLTMKKTLLGSDVRVLAAYDDAKVGTKTVASIVKLLDKGAIVEFFGNVTAFLPAVEMSEAEIKDPREHFRPGQTLHVNVISVHPQYRKMRVSCLDPKSPKALVKVVQDEPADPIMVTDVTTGSRWTATVTKVDATGVWVKIGAGIRGRISLIEVSNDLDVLRDVAHYHAVGSAVDCVVTKVDTKNKLVQLSARAAAGAAPLKLAAAAVGEVCVGRVAKKTPTALTVQLTDTISATCALPDLSDDYDAHSFKDVQKNSFVKVKVVAFDAHKKALFVSTRASLTETVKNAAVADRYIDSVEDVHEGDVVRGFVKNIDRGLYVALGHSVTARVKISDLSDSFIKDWEKQFTVGKVVKGKVLSVDAEHKRVELTLKEGVVSGTAVAKLKLSDLAKGQTVKGSVKRVETFGVFIQLDNSDRVSGLCHKSNVSDGKVADFQGLFAEGDRVTAKVLDVNLEKRQLSLGLKASLFVGDDAEEEEEEDDEEDEEDEEDDDDALAADSDDSAASADQLMSDDDADSATPDEDVDEVEIKIADDSSDDEAMADAPAADGSLDVAGFDWSANVLDQLQPGSDSESDDDEADGRRKRRKRAVVQQDITGELDGKAPEAAVDYERLVLSQPSSSLLWIKYIAFQLQLGEVDKAREIGQRALKTIGFREEDEKLNVWTALLNVENSFGSPESLDETFKQACVYMDQKVMHQKLAAILVQSHKAAEADALYQTMLKKFSQSCKIWLAYAGFLVDAGRLDDARDVLQRALQTLPKRKHVKAITKFAQLEFAKGEPERGRTLFEGLVSSFPRRIDIWNVFIDIEAKNGQHDAVRALYERVLTTKLSAKQAKFLFKKWLAYEQKHGNEGTVATVKEKAADYVAQRNN